MSDLQDQIRGSGRTRRQMEAAPQGATFIWCNDHTFYPKDIAYQIGRLDLKIVTPRAARETLIGHRRVHVVVDHALSDEEVARLRPYIELAMQGAAA